MNVLQSLNTRSLAAAVVVFAGIVTGGCSSQPATQTAEPAPSPAETDTAPETVVYRPFPENSFHDLLVAEFAIRRQRYDVALDNYLNQAEATGDLGVISTAARLAQFVNANAEALHATEMWLEHAPDDPDAHFIRASSLASSHRPLEALPHMIKVMNSGGQTNFAALAASALGLAESEQRDFQQALEELLVSHGDHQNLKIGLALMMQYRKQEARALELIREVLEQKPTSIHALLIETRALQQLDRNDEAIERLKFAVDTYPYNKRLRLNLAQLLTRQDLFQAKAQYTVLANQFPRDVRIQLALALVNREIGDYDEARRLLQALTELPEAADEAHYFLARIAEQEKDWPAAIAHYESIGPGDQLIAAITRLALLQNEQQGLDTARQRLSRARAEHPEHRVQFYLVESELLFERRQYENGHRLLSEALASSPNNTDLLYARSLFSERRRNVSLMERDLRTILNKEPDNATALNALGYSLAILTDRLAEARKLVGKALSIRPEDPAIQDSYGWIAYRLGDLELAETYLERAFRQSKDHEIAAHLGEVLWRLGRQQRARAVWAEGLAQEPDSPIILETLERLNIDRPVPGESH